MPQPQAAKKIFETARPEEYGIGERIKHPVRDSKRKAGRNYLDYVFHLDDARVLKEQQYYNPGPWNTIQLENDHILHSISPSLPLSVPMDLDAQNTRFMKQVRPTAKSRMALADFN